MALRTIDISGRDKVKGPSSDQPELRYVPIAQLVIDESYQRAVERQGWKNIERIARNFDWSRFSPLMVSTREDGLLAVIDGQHRAHAAALCGIKDVPALVSNLSATEQASAFTWINGTVTALTPNQIFRAALAAFEPWAVQCNAVVESAGCRLMPFNKSSSDRAPGEVFPVGTVRRFVEAGNEQYLAAVLRGVKDSVMSDDVRYYNSYGLSALVPAAVNSGVTRSAVIADFLSKHDLSSTASKVHRLLEMPEHRGKGFQKLFAESVQVLMQAHVRGAI